MKLEKIKNFVKEKHGNQKRKQGTPYYLHPFAVADILKDNGYNLDCQITGLFHDLLEDTETTYEEILSLSNDQVATAVKLLTKEKGYNMDDYIANIEENNIAKTVKLVDRIHNLSEAHLASEGFIKKYIEETKKWYLKLSQDTPFEKELVRVLENLEEEM